MPRILTRAVAASTLLYALSIQVSAQTIAPEIPRQQAMQQMARAAKTIAGMFAGKLPYEKNGFRQAAGVLLKHSGTSLVAQFNGNVPSNSSADDQKIAAERQSFDEIALRLGQLAAAFDRKAAEAGDTMTPDMRMKSALVGGGSVLGSKPLRNETDLGAIPTEHLFHMVLESCTSCHGKFRRRR